MKRHRLPLFRPKGAHSWPVPQYLLAPEWSELRVDEDLQTAGELAASSVTVAAGMGGPRLPSAA